eukprot:6171109-Amphidinium_carterae.2
MLCQAENAHLPTIRWHSTRSVPKRILVTPESALLAFMHAKSAAGPVGTAVAFAALWGYFRKVCTDASPLPEWSSISLNSNMHAKEARL